MSIKLRDIKLNWKTYNIDVYLKGIERSNIGFRICIIHVNERCNIPKSKNIFALTLRNRLEGSVWHRKGNI
jgi:hypothetical protein